MHRSKGDTLSSFHSSVFLNRFVKLLKQEEAAMIQEGIKPEQETDVAQKQSVFQSLTKTLTDDLSVLSHESLLHMMNSLCQTKNLKSLKEFRLKSGELSIIEALVLKNFHAFVSLDITIPIMTIYEHGGNPVMILRQLNRMVNLSIFGKP